jgi:hypothetical protein
MRLTVGALMAVMIVGCGSAKAHSTSSTTTALPASITVNGQTYTRATDARIDESTSSVWVNNLPWLTPYPLADYPPSSIVVTSTNGFAPYLWTGSQLVPLVAPCAVETRGSPGAC